MATFFSLLGQHWDAFLAGAVFSVTLSFTAIVCGVLVGLILAFGLLSENRLIRYASNIYRSIWRGTPLLIQLLIIFYFLPHVGIELPPLGAACLALSMNTAAFQAEIYRGGLIAIPAGHTEAARMLGMTPFQIRKNILLPQMFRTVLPSLTNEATSLLKNSSLILVIGVTELLRTGQQVVSTTYRPLEVYLIIALTYLVMTVSLGLLGRALERRLSKSERVSHGI